LTEDRNGGLSMLNNALDAGVSEAEQPTQFTIKVYRRALDGVIGMRWDEQFL
jgi:hypothetical protein